MTLQLGQRPVTDPLVNPSDPIRGKIGPLAPPSMRAICIKLGANRLAPGLSRTGKSAGFHPSPDRRVTEPANLFQHVFLVQQLHGFSRHGFGSSSGLMRINKAACSDQNQGQNSHYFAGLFCP
jgi:hypothetical protein